MRTGQAMSHGVRTSKCNVIALTNTNILSPSTSDHRENKRLSNVPEAIFYDNFFVIKFITLHKA